MTARCFGWHGLWFGLAAWTGLALCAPAHAASFDCAKASTAIEKMICGDDALSKLDEQLNAAYKTALQDTQHAEATRQAQKQWLKTRNACRDKACVQQAYASRIAAFPRPVIPCEAAPPPGYDCAPRQSPVSAQSPQGSSRMSGQPTRHVEKRPLPRGIPAILERFYFKYDEPAVSYSPSQEIRYIGSSLNCDAATETWQKVVCNNNDLLELDARVQSALINVQKDPVHAEKAQTAHATWQETVLNPCQTVECLTEAYTQQLSYLAGICPLDNAVAFAKRKPLKETYKLVMSKDDAMCEHMQYHFNEDAAVKAWFDHEKHPEFYRIPWRKVRYSFVNSGITIHWYMHGAVYDLTNDGNFAFVLYDKSLLSNKRADSLEMLDVNEAQRKSELSTMEMSGKNVIRFAGYGGYPLPPEWVNSIYASAWLISPFIYNGTSYILFWAMETALPNDLIIAKYHGGRFLAGDTSEKIAEGAAPGKMENICFLKINR